MNMETHFADVTIDKVSKYWNHRPCNIRHSPKEVGTREFFDEVEARKYFVEPHIPGFAEFKRWSGRRVLEIGCGIGTDTINFACAGAFVTAVDLSEKSLSIARQRADVFQVSDQITFHQANAEDLNKVVPVETYDLVYSFGVIHHTPHPERVIAQIRNYLGPNSIFKMMVYHRYSWKVFWMTVTDGKCAFWDLDRIIARNSEAQTGCPVTYSYTRKSVGDLLQGFELQDVRIDHVFPWSIQEYIHYKYKKVWYFKLLPKYVFREIEKRIGWHLCVSAKLESLQF